ncbi:MAG: hypothetical protein H7Z41_05210, partial [Cytophagales bacterium]|nr:hypothetical protein [Armatimonadota bacterium]
NPAAGSRLPLGYFTLNTVGKITGGTIRLDLWNAEATGIITTESGSVRWRGLVHADEMILMVEVERVGGEQEAALEWHSEAAVPPRFLLRGSPKGYVSNPASEQGAIGEISTCFQPLTWGGETATAWHERRDGAKSALFLSAAHTHPKTGAVKEATAAVRKAIATDQDRFVSSHRRWWHAFYPASFLSVPDARWESFYWIQLYKLASATRADRALIDNQGPWLQPTPWAGAWWNLNVQLTYWPTCTANHPELAESLTRRLDRYQANLLRNVPEEYRNDSAAIPRVTGQDLTPGAVGVPGTGPEMGNLLWAMHNYWLQYRATMDDRRLRENLFPLLKRSVAYYLHFLTPDAAGVLHLPSTYSPEYGAGPDCNYDLALLHWGLQTLIAVCARLGIADPLLPKWTETLAHLTDYPTDETGYQIARGVPFDKGHRHFSHLLMGYPLHLVNREQPGAQERIQKSVKHWHSMGGRQGYSFTGGALLLSAFGEGDESLALLNGLNPFLQASTLYKEAGPVIETPLSAATAIHEMLLQSWGDKIRVFPAMPDRWADAIFHDLRAEGAFLVSARRTGGVTQFVRIRSLAGEPCRIVPGLPGEARVFSTRPLTLQTQGSGVYSLDLRKGEEAILYTGTSLPDLRIAALASPAAESNAWGLKTTEPEAKKTAA